MNDNSLYLSGVERTFDVDEIIVSKTDLKGRITYANRVFLKVAGYTEEEVLGKPHNCIRHPAMPRCVFRLLWSTIQSGKEIFAYVINRAKNGDHYWVFAHVTPSIDRNGRVVGYHSNRRSPSRSAIEAVEPIYANLVEAERPFSSPIAACAASTPILESLLAQQGVSYDEFVFSLARPSTSPKTACVR